MKEKNNLKDVLNKDYFPTALVNNYIKIFLNKQFAQKIVRHTIPKEDLFIVLPYLGMSSLCMRTSITAE